MSEYRLPEEDTIGGRRDDEAAEEDGPEPESGEKPAPRPAHPDDEPDSA